MNTLVFDIENYNNDVSDLMFAVSKAIELLTTNGYIVEFYYEDCGHYVLNYDYKDGELASNHLFWLNDEEAEEIISMRTIDHNDFGGQKANKI